MAFQQLTTLARNLQATKMTTSIVQRHLCSGIIPRNSGRTDYETLAVSTPKPYVFHVELNRPKRLNAFNKRMWMDIKECFEELSMNPDCRAIVISAAGKHFTAGIDLADMMGLAGELGDIEDPARKGVLFERLIRLYQESISSLELCPKPVIAAVHSACIGAGVDLSSTADIRYCTKDAYFQIKEVDIGMAADVGTLQRFPKAIGSQSLARELCFTARPFKSDEAKQCGFISEVFADKESMLQGALELANTIAEKSPIAVQATKANIIYSQSRPNQEGLDHIREINKLNLQSEDLANAVAAQLTKGEKPIYSKL